MSEHFNFDGFTQDQLLGDPLTLAICSVCLAVALFGLITLFVHIGIRGMHPFNRRPQLFLNLVIISLTVLPAAYAIRSLALIDCSTSKPLFWAAYGTAGVGLIMHGWQVLFYSLVNLQVKKLLRRMNRGKDGTATNQLASMDQDSWLMRNSWAGRTSCLFFVYLVLSILIVGQFFLAMLGLPWSRSSPALDFWTDTSTLFAGNFDTRCTFTGETVGYGVLLFVLILFIVPLMVTYARNLKQSADGLGLIFELRVMLITWPIVFAVFAVLQSIHPSWVFGPLVGVFVSFLATVWWRYFVSRRKNIATQKLRDATAMNGRTSLVNRGSVIAGAELDMNDVNVQEVLDLRSLEVELSSNERFRSEFTFFLQSELCLETLMFYDMSAQFKLALTEWKNVTRAKQIFADIINYFVGDQAVLQVNFSSKSRDPILKASKLVLAAGDDGEAMAAALTPSIFDKGRAEVLSLIENDAYPRFKLLKMQGKLKKAPPHSQSSSVGTDSYLSTASSGPLSPRAGLPLAQALSSESMTRAHIQVSTSMRNLDFEMSTKVGIDEGTALEKVLSAESTTSGLDPKEGETVAVTEPGQKSESTSPASAITAPAVAAEQSADDPSDYELSGPPPDQ